MSRRIKVEGATNARVLTRLFLRRLMDNDLISPHADRHESLVVTYAVVQSVAVFVTFFISTDYLAAFIQLPGPTALGALSDRFLFIAASMAVSALATLMVWDALPLEPRDAAILGPLPIAGSAITRAKLAAAVVFGTVFAMAMNAVPSVLYPAFLTMNLRGMSGVGILQLIGGQALTVVMAGLLGFFGILSLRSVLRLLLGERGFRRVSSAAQSALVVCAVAALLLAPTVGATDVRNWVAGVAPPRWPAVPVLWHLGVDETVAGHIVAEAPLVLPPRVRLLAPVRRRNDESRTAYRALRPRLSALARSAWLALPLAACLAVASFLWTNRRLPEPSDGSRTRSRTGAALRAVLDRLTRGDPETQAGFFFTLQVLTRSAPHRMILAVSVAAAVALPFVTLVRGNVPGHVAVASTPLGLFGIQIMVLSSFLTAFRYAVTVPAELASNWSIRMAWLGDERGYLAGAKRAALVSLVMLPLLALLPLHVALFGPRTALVHSLSGVLFGVLALDALFLGYRKLPFACSYLPIPNLKLVWCISAAGFLLVTYGFAYVERLALQSPTGTAAMAATLGGVVVALKVVDRAERREPRPLNFDEGPEPATQRLGLFDRIAIHD